MDSGYDDKKLDIDWRMRNELEKFEDGDDKVRRLLNFSGPSSSKSSIESANLSSLAGNVSTSSGNGSFHDEAISEDVFLPSKRKFLRCFKYQGSTRSYSYKPNFFPSLLYLLRQYIY